MPNPEPTMLKIADLLWVEYEPISTLDIIKCKFGFHEWLPNKNGVRICNRCLKVDRYYGITGLIRKNDELTWEIENESDDYYISQYYELHPLCK